MNLLNAILVGFKEIWAHKFRSLLTMLGIILGVSSLVGMSALVKGMENGMREALVAVGGVERVRIEQADIPAEQAHLADQAPGITMNDVYALKHNATLTRLITPEMRLRNVTITRGGRHATPFIFMGTWPSALEMNEHEIQYGRMFNEIDDESARSVCVIGTEVRDALFGSPEELGYDYNPVGQQVNIQNQVFTIVGMFKYYESEQDRRRRLAEQARLQVAAMTSTNSAGGASRDRGRGGRGRASWVFRVKNNTVYIPLNTMWLRFRTAAGTNNTPDPRLTGLAIKVADVDVLEPAIEQAHKALLRVHNGVEDFSFETQENWAENIASAIRNARMSGGIIAAIALLVGGIGIMNIMLASITERIREIGIRKAIGATGTAIFIQILVESVVIAIIGGLAGLVTSFGLVHVLTSISPTDNAPEITFLSCAVAFSFSVGVGILAGLIPAFKAARLDPIQALRYE
ncbi:MAG TPA: ABC transporter permease [Verrucomicrobia bacterium]|nr:ABC transporter permease [Verrucomicrobiota bacterium]HOP98188.1 ABC transporter permease [Verrucomicrobiota bacterium]HPU54874.1 ABC transporter permease [Verrucomicrobiota bacterium]